MSMHGPSRHLHHENITRRGYPQMFCTIGASQIDHTSGNLILIQELVWPGKRCGQRLRNSPSRKQREPPRRAVQRNSNESYRDPAPVALPPLEDAVTEIPSVLVDDDSYTVKV